MGGWNFPFFGRDRCAGFGPWGGWDGGWKGGCGDEKRIAVITAVRAIAAKGDGCFDGKWWN